MPTPALHYSKETSKGIEGHKFDQLSDSCNHGGPNHYKSCISNISGAKPSDNRQRDWFASEHDAKRLQEAGFESHGNAIGNIME